MTPLSIVTWESLYQAFLLLVSSHSLNKSLEMLHSPTVSLLALRINLTCFILDWWNLVGEPFIDRIEEHKSLVWFIQPYFLEKSIARGVSSSSPLILMLKALGGYFARVASYTILITPWCLGTLSWICLDFKIDNFIECEWRKGNW